MTTMEFTTSIKSRWKDADIEDLTFIGKELDGYKEEDYERIYTEFRRTYPYNTAPRVAHIVKAINSLGLKRSFARQDKSEYCYKCDKCGQLFAGRLSWNSVYCCPKCYSREMTIIADQDRKEVVTYQEMCVCGWGDYQINNIENNKGESRCDIWEKQRGAYGPVCDKFGNMRGSDKECQSCACRNCCNKYKEEKEQNEY